MKNEIVKRNVTKLLPIFANLGDATPTARTLSALHRHDELEFLPIYQGVFHCYTESGACFDAVPGDVIFINSGVPHATACEDGTRNGLLQFKQKDFLDTEVERVVRYSSRLDRLSEAGVRILHDREFFDTVDRLFREVAQKQTAYEMFAKGRVYDILGFLYRAGILTDAEKIYNSKEVQKILPALSYINEKYAEDIDLSEISALLGFDPSYFCRIFKSAIGATFTEYLNFVRICKAEKLIAKGESSILEIADAVGFSSVSYFNRIFRKYHSCSPSYYRTVQYKNHI